MKKFRVIACLLLLVSLFFLPEPNNDYLFLQTVKQMAGAGLDKMRSLLDDSDAETDAVSVNNTAFHLKTLVVEGGGEESGLEAIEREIRRLIVLDHKKIFLGPAGDAWHLGHDRIVRMESDDASRFSSIIPFSIRAVQGSDHGTLFFECREAGIHETQTRPFFKWYSILPPFLAIFLALLLQRTLLALFAGVWLGATLLEGSNPVFGLWRFIHKYLYEEALLDQFRLDIIGFVIALCATVGLLTRGAGIQGFVNKIVGLAKTVRSTQMVTYLLGLGIFFDDYTNCIIVGNTSRPLTDRMKISREKLSYIVDSTAAPVAGLSMVSTWIAYEVSTFSPQLPEAGITQGAYEVFVQTIPFRFYCIMTLAFIAMQIFFQRDFGPMRTAENRARKSGEVIRSKGRPLVSSSMTEIRPKTGAPPRWLNAFLPISVIVIVTLEEMWRLGGGDGAAR